MPVGGSLEIVGLSGAGKSTIAKALSESLSLPSYDFADLLLTERHSVSASHDNILTWSPDELGQAVKQVQDILSEKAKKGETYILETHICPFISGDGFVPTPFSEFFQRNPIGIILLLPNCGQLNERRKNRAHDRDRIPITNAQFAIQQQATLAASITLATLAGISLYVHQDDVLLEELSNTLSIIAARWISRTNRKQ